MAIYRASEVFIDVPAEDLLLGASEWATVNAVTPAPNTLHTDAGEVITDLDGIPLIFE